MYMCVINIHVVSFLASINTRVTVANLQTVRLSLRCFNCEGSGSYYFVSYSLLKEHLQTGVIINLCHPDGTTCTV